MTDTPTRHCAQCQHPLLDTDQFCGSCGAPVTSKAEPATTPASTKPPVLGCVLLLLIAGAVIWGVIGICQKATQHTRAIHATIEAHRATVPAVQQSTLAHRATVQVHRATTAPPLLPAQSGTVTIDAESGKVVPSPPASSPASSETQGGSSSSEASSDGLTRRIAGDNRIGATTKEEYEKLKRYSAEKDYDAFSQALAEGLLAGTCTRFQNGEEVYLEDSEGFLGNLVKVRRKGDTTTYWTNSEALK